MCPAFQLNHSCFLGAWLPNHGVEQGWVLTDLGTESGAGGEARWGPPTSTETPVEEGEAKEPKVVQQDSEENDDSSWNLSKIESSRKIKKHIKSNLEKVNTLAMTKMFLWEAEELDFSHRLLGKGWGFKCSWEGALGACSLVLPGQVQPLGDGLSCPHCSLSFLSYCPGFLPLWFSPLNVQNFIAKAEKKV